MSVAGTLHRRQELRAPSRRARLRLSEGLLSAIPMLVLLVAGFFAPLALVILYSFMPRGSFSPSASQRSRTTSILSSRASTSRSAGRCSCRC